MTPKAKHEKFDAVGWHRKLITPTRFKPGGSSVKNRTIDEEAASDRARVIYSSAFRRLQHKTQVFTLSKDAAVRTRLTHSLPGEFSTLQTEYRGLFSPALRSPMES